MNQEYTRQTVKKLLWLSDWIVSEIDSKSDNYWDNHLKFIDGRVEKILTELEVAQNAKSLSLLTTELWIDPWLYRQHNTARLIRTDPFLPKQLRVKVADYYDKRVSAMADIYNKVMTRFCNDLYKGKLKDRNSELKIIAWTRLGDVYFKKGWGWEKAEKRIEELRADIEKYLTNLK